jgi:hypothetical protein
MLLSILFNQQFDNASTNEALCTTTCPACKTQQTLAEATHGPIG